MLLCKAMITVLHETDGKNVILLVLFHMKLTSRWWTNIKHLLWNSICRLAAHYSFNEFPTPLIQSSNYQIQKLKKKNNPYRSYHQLPYNFPAQSSSRTSWTYPSLKRQKLKLLSKTSLYSVFTFSTVIGIWNSFRAILWSHFEIIKSLYFTSLKGVKFLLIHIYLTLFIQTSQILTDKNPDHCLLPLLNFLEDKHKNYMVLAETNCQVQILHRTLQF